MCTFVSSRCAKASGWKPRPENPFWPFLKRQTLVLIQSRTVSVTQGSRNENNVPGRDVLSDGCETKAEVCILESSVQHLLRLFTGRNVEWNLLCRCSKTAGFTGPPYKNGSKSLCLFELYTCGIMARRCPEASCAV